MHIHNVIFYIIIPVKKIAIMFQINTSAQLQWYLIEETLSGISTINRICHLLVLCDKKLDSAPFRVLKCSDCIIMTFG